MFDILLALSQPLRPQFPLTHPSCRHCGWEPRFNCTVWTERNGNFGRPYFICVKCKHHNRGVQHREGWITWDDERGICDGNPPCYCGALSRQDRAGANTSMPGQGFWTCATGSCDYFSKYRNGWTDKEVASNPFEPECVGFFPWLL